ncbi:hypothetical protein A4A49_26509 [Nicotiana attenuata]|uniref:Uncharacterized protein n=1 Tax=Nicotiana attenuata TaxID=49451 RepID=A0A1J6KCE0_NICAT|nr:hypothetical protein A4A49_26509 [Nicotiana attenuata]
MVLLHLIFHYDGDWIKRPQVLYSRKLVHTIKGFNSDQLSYNYLVNEFTSKLGFIGVQQVIVNGPSGRYYEIKSDEGVRTLLSLVSDQFNVIGFFAVDECELSINVHNIVHHIEPNMIELDAATDCSSDDSEEHGWQSSDSSDNSDSESDSLELLHAQKDRKISVEHLMKYPPESWSRAYFDTVRKNYSVDNNLTESFNSWIKEARFKPIIKMLEEIRVKNSKGKQPMASKKKGKQAKRQRCLATQDSNDDQPMSPLASNVPAEEDIDLSAPLFSQASQSSHPVQASQFQFMPTPSVQRKPPNNTVPPDFESDSAPEIRPRSFSEERTRLLMRQQGTIPAITRTINFVGDSSGVRKKAVTKKGNGKSQSNVT